MFNQFNLDKRVLEAIAKLNFTTPTPVQAKTIAPALEGRDVVGLAETGSGKTIAYLAPTMTHVLQRPEAHVLILAPTRELATQIGNVIRDLSSQGQSKHFSSVILIGGAAMSLQVRGLRAGPRFMIATPGRLMDHVRQRTIDLRKITHLILDEADRMFDMGFAPQVNEIVRQLSSDRQTMLFSATFPKEIRGLAERVLRDKVEIEVRSSERPPVVIEQKVIEVDNGSKNNKTLEVINEADGSVVIFTRTKHRTDRLSKFLEQYGVKVARIHGDRSQAQRNKSIADFKAGYVKVLVATDIAARGLDVPSISNVLNYDVPMTTDDYVHRIGRTGRAGQSGQSLTFVSHDEQANWNFIARKMGLEMIGSAPGKEGRHARPPTGGRGAFPGQRREGGGGRSGGGFRGARNSSGAVSYGNAGSGGGNRGGGRGGKPSYGNRPSGGARDQGQREHAPREHAPREHAPREHAPRDHAPRDANSSHERKAHSGGDRPMKLRGDGKPLYGFDRKPKAHDRKPDFKPAADRDSGSR